VVVVLVVATAAISAAGVAVCWLMVPVVVVDAVIALCSAELGCETMRCSAALLPMAMQPQCARGCANHMIVHVDRIITVRMWFMRELPGMPAKTGAFKTTPLATNVSTGQIPGTVVPGSVVSRPSLAFMTSWAAVPGSLAGPKFLRVAPIFIYYE